MSLLDDRTSGAPDFVKELAESRADVTSDFRFVPKELAAKCRKLIESYHAMHGYGQLPDMLWHSDARDVIECQRDLAKIFKNASKSRCAKRANESFALIATVVVSLEILARDFAGWGKRFPGAKRQAEALLIDLAQRNRDWFMDKYLYPSLTLHHEMASALAPSPAEPAFLRH